MCPQIEENAFCSDTYSNGFQDQSPAAAVVADFVWLRSEDNISMDAGRVKVAGLKGGD